MSKDIREESAAQTVRSKYFTTKSAMDESLTDFQEPKKLAGPKKTTKTKPEKPKRAPKRIRGQKDIRAALKSNKNELDSYAKDFDKVCKHAGLDVDSEQLQLAIALSKSLQQSASTSGDSPETSQSNTQDRVGKIRTTLLEYGFKIPEIKITTTRRLKKRKNYKLLQTSEEAKKQIISNKYSQVLFHNISPSNSLEGNEIDSSLIQFYHLATNATYSILKNINTFYVDNLLEKSTSTGNLLRDWSEIPGRPVSPKLCERTSMNFSEIECSQDELDIVLSGSLKNCKNVIKTKQREICVSEHHIIKHNELVTTVNLDNSPVILIGEENQTPNSNNEKLIVQGFKIMDLAEPKHSNVTLKPKADEIIHLDDPLETVKKYRSCSPDLFDDEPSTIEDNTKTNSQEIQSPLMDTAKAVSVNNHGMDLTECVQYKSLKSPIYSNPSSQLSQNTYVTRRFNDTMEITDCVEVQCIGTKISEDITKRKSNDFMEITNVVAGSIQTLSNGGAIDIDLTQSPEIEKISTITEVNIQKHEPEIDKSNIENENIAKNKHIPEIANVTDNNIDLTESPEVVNNNNDTVLNVAGKSTESLDLTQSSNTSDELPFVSLTTNQRKNKELNQSPDTTILIDPQEYEEFTDSAVVQCVMHDETNHDLQEEQNKEIELNSGKEAQKNVYSLHSSQNVKTPEDILDLTQEIVIITRHNSKTSETNVSFCKEYIHSNSDNLTLLDLTQNVMHEETNDDLQEEKNELYSEKEGQKIVCSLDSSQNLKKPEDIMDLTQEIVIISRHNSKTSETNVSFFEEYVHNHSDNNDFHEEIDCDNNLYKDPRKNISIPDVNIVPEECLSSGGISTENYLIQNDDSSHELSHDLQDKNSTESKCQSIESETYNDGKASLSDIDLTQSSEPEELSLDLQNKDCLSLHSLNLECEVDCDATIEMEVIKSSQRCSSLGKKDDVSIDYDELYDNLLNKFSNSQQSRSLSISATENNLSNVSNKSKDISNCSQNSEVFVISDNEFDYSMNKSKLEKPVDNFFIGGLSIMDELSGLSSFRRSTNSENNAAVAYKNVKTTDDFIEIEDDKPIEIEHLRKTPVKHKRVHELATPQKPSCSGINTVMTPSNSEYQIKTKAVTPMPNYEAMSLEEIHEKLDNFGVKPFKRKRAIQLLTHIYNQTHPTVEPYSDEESPCKRRKTNNYSYSPQKDSPIRLTPRKILLPKKTAKSPRKIQSNEKSPRKVPEKGKETSKERKKRLNNVGVTQSVNKNYEVNEEPVIKEVVCSPDDWVFQKREKAKVHSCRVPLHIAFHNYVSSRRELREAILCYEPINIDHVHKDLVAYGHRYDPKDLLKYMDKKCITVKTTDNDARNQKRY